MPAMKDDRDDHRRELPHPRSPGARPHPPGGGPARPRRPDAATGGVRAGRR
ncbi:hypothetical protein SFR_0386 [Streptomyces sp. FR-008]|nr:hypothetical protein SFR_0386 [Streptomyces sp. FR-008]